MVRIAIFPRNFWRGKIRENWSGVILGARRISSGYLLLEEESRMKAAAAAAVAATVGRSSRASRARSRASPGRGPRRI